MGLAARKLDVGSRCPKCGKDVAGCLKCGHCGYKLPAQQKALYSAVLAKLLGQSSSNGWRPLDATQQRDASESEPSIIPISSGLASRAAGNGGCSAPSVNHERYTPSALVDLVHKALGRIDLDPASSKEANKVVKAKSFFTKRDNGLKQRWRGRIFLNPPFDDWPTWVAKLDEEIQAHRVKQAVVVGPANISAFRPLLKRKGLLLVPNERPKYYDPSSDELIAPPFGSLLCYVGQGHGRFVSVFRKHGILLRVV